ncbi:hypothetical protein Pla123a_05970 [Posidoniimonas polymericola]|uniref:Putative glutamine amidotransferase domain-containing protein n=1 Tax=Posidoniimonas polymericola TaxID=2528002 RepID=A0A5C5ZFB5_9BACT|nr:glutamine amidotransferase [Posidoniimonas polymericola]TWT85790.1 hypothetical protein Pla123a_05970 [Posidoniimonas polymericola]
MSWTLNPVGGPWLVAIIAAVLLGLCAVRPRGTLTRRRRLSLAALRIAACLMLLFALLRPEVVRTQTEVLRSALLVLVDSSRSMTVEDSLGGKSRWASAMELLNQSRGSLEQLGRDHDLEYYTFDQSLRPAAGADALRGVTPNGDGTALGKSLAELLENEASERLLGVVLLSDGAQRAVPPSDLAPQVAARRYALEGTPIFPFAFGSPAGGARSDVAIDDLLASNSVFANTPTRVTGRLRVDGYPNQTLTVQLQWEDENGQLQVVDATQITAGPAAAEYPISLQHTPSRLGEQKVQLRIEAQPGEVLTSNNAQATFVTVREGGVRVLYLTGAKRIGGEPGVEQRFVRGSLAASPDIVVTRRKLDYDPERESLTRLLDANDYDVYLLDDVDADALDAATWEEIAECVRQGAGLMMTGGHHSFGPGGHDSSPLTPVLPVTPGRLERQRFGEPLRTDMHLADPVRMRPARPFGVRHPIMQIAPNAADAWDALPPMTGANRFVQRTLKPNAQVLAEDPEHDGAPLLVASQPGAGRSLAFAGDSTWRWVMAGQGEAHRRFWRQAILWLAQKDDSKKNPVWVELASRRVARGAPLEITVGANPAEGNSAPVELEVTVRRPNGDTRTVPIPAGENGGAGVFREIDLAGDYLVTATGRQSGTVIGSAQARFTAPDNDVELDQPGAEPAVLAQLAQITEQAGGRSLAPEELPDLLAELAAADPEVLEEVVARVTYWDTWPFFLLLVALLSVEWWLRKRWGLV